MIKLTESEKKRISELYNKNNNLLLEFVAPQGLIQTIKTPIENLQLLPCKANKDCDSVIWINGEGGTYKYKLNISTPLGTTGLKYREFKKIPSGYEFIGYPTNSAVAGAILAAKSTETNQTIKEFTKLSGLVCVSNPYAIYSVKDMSNKVIVNPTPMTWTASQNKYCAPYKIPVIGKYREIITTENKPKSDNFFGTSELKIFFTSGQIQQMQKSLTDSKGEKGSIKLDMGTITMVYQPS